MLQNPQWRWFSCPVVVTVISEGLGLVAGQVRLPLCFHDSKKNQLLISIAPKRVGMGSDKHVFSFLGGFFIHLTPVQRDKRREARKGILIPLLYPLRNQAVPRE